MVSLLYKLITSAKDSKSLSIGFGRKCVRRQRELTNDKNVKRKHQVRYMLKNFWVLRNIKEKLPTD